MLYVPAKYIADDGIEFEDEDECLRHEQMIRVSKQFDYGVKWYNHLGYPTDNPREVEFATFPCEEAYVDFCHLRDEYGYIAPFMQYSLNLRIYYDHHYDEWIDFDDRFEWFRQIDAMFNEKP